jgi:hypothetical protein
MQLPLTAAVAVAVTGIVFVRDALRAKAIMCCVLLSLPVFLYLVGKENMGMWCQRRLIALWMLLSAALLAGFPEALRAVRQRLSPSRRFIFGVAVGALLLVAACANPIRWRAPYRVAFDYGADAWVSAMGTMIGSRLAVFDWYHYSVPMAAAGYRVLGISEAVTRRKDLCGDSEFRQEGFDRVLAWVAAKAEAEEVLWVSAFDPPAFDSWFTLDPVGTVDMQIDRLASRYALPALRETVQVRARVYRVVPWSAVISAPKCVHHRFDGGLLGKRGPWGRKDYRYFPDAHVLRENYWIDEPYFSSMVNDIFRNGVTLGGCVANSGCAVIGPVPHEGEAIEVQIKGMAMGGPVICTVIPPWPAHDHLAMSFQTNLVQTCRRVSVPCNTMTLPNVMAVPYILSIQPSCPDARLWISDIVLETVHDR